MKKKIPTKTIFNVKYVKLLRELEIRIIKKRGGAPFIKCQG